MELHDDMRLYVDIIGDDKLTLDVIPITTLKKDYSILIEILFKRLETISVKVGTLYSDKEFCNDDAISALTTLEILLSHVNPIKKSKRNSIISKKKMGIRQLFLNTSLMKIEQNLILWQCLMKINSP